MFLPKECKESWSITAGEMRAVTITVCACVLMYLHCFYRLGVGERLVNLRVQVLSISIVNSDTVQ